jgi:cell division protease FtsH
MVTTLGMSDKLGPRTFGDKQEMVFLGREIAEQKDYSDETAKQIDDEVYRIIQESYHTAKEILTKNKSKLVRLAEKLIAQETLEGGELEAVFSEISPKPAAEVKPTLKPVPVEPVAEAKPEVKPKKAPVVPRLVPKQTPAPSD